MSTDLAPDQRHGAKALKRIRREAERHPDVVEAPRAFEAHWDAVDFQDHATRAALHVESQAIKKMIDDIVAAQLTPADRAWQQRENVLREGRRMILRDELPSSTSSRSFGYEEAIHRADTWYGERLAEIRQGMAS